MSADAAVRTMHGLLDRLEEAVAEETLALTQRRLIDFDEVNRRKSRSLLELSRAVRSLPDTVDSGLTDRLKVLRAALQRNSDLLQFHLVAAQHVTAILGDALRETESDGTYSAATATRRDPA
ncbi:hypothetical protein KHC23_22090 [Ancylobacter dichloromethanicus]|uniref:Flagellar protein FlgN n=1 Tax=Ancylobacter dichloromethanicus TaxID=518825 RepID=A0A9W6MXN6_9HYPH|nr:hypothetical protein [Ancylobacter dichloromethanicus]MBS7556327.1 hypothetical protein [Ancylobacter dichloromethanicus]GLK70090.1 hypothetical protein GCM10017643_02050 [Ancylobacter dichloromethanicus]